MHDPTTCHIVGTIPRMTLFSSICTMALVFMMALVGPARPLTIAFRPMREVNISREEERNEIEML